jgi:hypothetical protein
MQNCNGWLVLYDGDTLPITIKIDSIQEVAKHYATVIAAPCALKA